MDDLQSKLHQPLLQQIISLLPGDLPIYLVGGAIRDALLNRPNYDLDFIVEGNALKIARQIADKLNWAYFPLDTKRKVARVIYTPEIQEDGKAEHLSMIDFSSYQGVDLASDLKGRDFTINAMAVEVHHPEKLIDLFGGAADLLSKRLVACSPTSLMDDPVRILRATRFAVNLKLRITPETLRLIKQASEKIPEVSIERLRDELFRILVQPHPSSALRILDSVHALEHMLPEVSMLKDVKQSAPHVLDAWNHTLDVLVQLENLLAALGADYNQEKTSNLAMGMAVLHLGRFRKNIDQHFQNALNPERSHHGLIFLAGLLHDIGKTKTQTTDEHRKTRFIDHERIGSQLVEKQARALKLSNLEVDRLVTIVNHHMRPSLLSHEPGILTSRAIYRFFRDTGSAGVDICILSLADILATYGPTLSQDRWVRHLETVRGLLSAWWEDPTGKIIPTPIIDGNDLILELEISPGPLIGYLLERIRESQVAGEIKTREDAIQLAKSLRTEQAD